MKFNPGTLYTDHQMDGIHEFWMENVEVIRECTLAETVTNDNIKRFWSTIIITLPEEPVRVDADSGYYTFY